MDTEEAERGIVRREAKKKGPLGGLPKAGDARLSD